MSKVALCIDTEQYKNLVSSFNNDKFISDIDVGENVYVNFLAEEIFNLPTRLVDRSICETDNTTLQLIPYVTMAVLKTDGVEYADPSHPETKFFVYTRGSKGKEERLHGKCSLGLGGHVEELPTENTTLQQVLYKAMVRELAEEAGVQASEETPENFTFDYLVFNDKDAVNRVHLGLCITLFVNPEDIKNVEEGVITKGQWLTRAEILSNTEIELEEWSKAYLTCVGNQEPVAVEGE